MVYQIGICDDEISTCSELKKILTDYFKISDLEMHINIWDSAEAFMCDVPSKVNVDILFLDIEMPRKNGVHVGEYIRNDMKNEGMHIIYVSSKTNYAMELFKVHPYDFIVKPIDRDKVINNISKLLELDEHDNRYFTYEYNRVKNKIRYGDIVYFESDRKHIKIICSDGTNKEFVGKISEIVDSLPSGFALAAQSFVINLRHISLYKKDSCIMDNGDYISIGRKHKNFFNKKIIEYNKCLGGDK